MVGKSSSFALTKIFVACVVGLATLGPSTALAQSSGDDGTGYQVNDSSSNNSDAAPPGESTGIGSGAESSGPVRLARFAAVRGNVTWRADDTMSWSQASNNMPLRQGGQIWVTNGGRAEVQFDDGSVLRLGNGALVTLNVLYSDAEGEFTQITLRDGLATIKARHAHSIYQVDTPLVSIKTTGPSRVRVGVANGVELAIQQGEATIEGAQGKQRLNTGDYLDLRDADSRYEVSNVPGPDNWDRWNDRQDRSLEGDYQSNHYLPPNISLVAGDLDSYGSWHNDAHYGEVWCPQVVDSDWRPYHDGHWTWVSPFGWTWVSSEPWGWAPYHYGSWIHQPYGWAWCPGPAQQYWCPAVVHFCETDSRVIWAPLAPSEVRYPSSISLGFHSGNWSLFFSIGQAAVYYPSESFWTPRPYNNVYVNHVTYINNVTNVTNVNNGQMSPSYNRYLLSAENFAANNRGNYSHRNLMPINAVRFAGASSVSLQGFGGSGPYRTLPLSEASLFTRGRSMAPPVSSRAPLAGPIAARPTLAALTSTRTMLSNARPPQSTLNRVAFHTPLPGAIRRAAGNSLSSGRPAGGSNGFRPAARADGMASTSNRRGYPVARIPRDNSLQPQARRYATQPRNAGRIDTGNRVRETYRPADQRVNPLIGSRRTNAWTGQDAAAQARASLGMTSDRGMLRSRSSVNSDRNTPYEPRRRENRYAPRPNMDRGNTTYPGSVRPSRNYGSLETKTPGSGNTTYSGSVRPSRRDPSYSEPYRQTVPRYQDRSVDRAYTGIPSYRDRSGNRGYSGTAQGDSRPMRTMERYAPSSDRTRSGSSGRSEPPGRGSDTRPESSGGSHKNSARP